jgi:uncharacterized membrane protein
LASGNRWLRLLKHRWFDEGDARSCLSKGAHQRMQARIAASEKQHTGEIRVCIESGLPWSYIRRRALPRERALSMFSKLRVWDTQHNNGVLIYLQLADHAIEIVADRGLSSRVDYADWQRLTTKLQAAFKAQKFEMGINRAIDVVTALLVRHFAVEEGASNPNELPDAPVMR